jgi:hypothetical protein
VRVDAGLAGHTDVPVDLRVVRLELGVIERPVREAGTGNLPEHTALVEVDLAEAPVVGREVHRRAADAARVEQRWPHQRRDRGLVRRAAERLLVADRVDGESAEEPVLELVVPQVGGVDARALLEHHHAESCSGEFACQDAAGGAGADDDEVHRLGGAIGLRAHLA